MREWITPDVLAMLRADPWFGSVPKDFERDLLSLATPRRLKHGEHLFFRGDAPDGLYAILEGTLRVSGVTEAGKEAILSLVDAPSWFGEIALFDRLPRTHNAVAEGAVKLLHIPQQDLLTLLGRAPHYWRELGVLMALRLRLTFISMEDLALLPAEARLARRLVWLVEASALTPSEGVCVVPISQTQLGLMLSLSRQTTNQVLQSLQDQGVLRVAYGRIEVLDRQRLMEVASVSTNEKRILSQLQGAGPKGRASDQG
ncbi:MAG: Crp/Fnr family transcriptional regulator [Aquabacterium sp.]|uniref:Crp/Fnr family transcriptional regulator n=1 Tax=Aquabacterium sp. TaxID=1872578 RepID=UPI0025BE89EE|nr:Crp/Fnr family transcriptional regulator [Aquabacterium sp.]MBI5927506.1 Crp/Fnr family transcriptional regulator [Aquabacterium sp.]